jgi:hypothetical protein
MVFKHKKWLSLKTSLALKLQSFDLLSIAFSQPFHFHLCLFLLLISLGFASSNFHFHSIFFEAGINSPQNGNCLTPSTASHAGYELVPR